MCINNTISKCIECGKELKVSYKLDGTQKKQTRKYCSKNCSYKATDRKRPNRVLVKTRGPFICKSCSKEYYTSRRKGEGEIYCSRECSFEYKTKLSEYEKLNKPAIYSTKAKYCSCCGNRFHTYKKEKYCSSSCRKQIINEQQKEASNKRKSATNCKICDCLFSKITGSKFCSLECLKENKRIERNKYRNKIGYTYYSRAKRKGVKAEKFNPFEIFERDNWKCEACGCDTPKTLRGTHNDNAPELDHIIPLSLHGEHSKNNTQTLCRLCNILKSNMPMNDFMNRYHKGWAHPK